jgi:hypothetical protein
MTETVEEMVEGITEGKVVKPDFKVRLSEKYAIDTDQRNIILLERYEKKDGKGKFANPTGEFGWRDLGYFRTLKHLAEWLVKHEMLTADGVTELRHFAEVIENLKAEIGEMVVEKYEFLKVEGD